MDFSGHIIHGEDGDLVCRAAAWTDVIKFFLLNYALHAFTSISQHGSGALVSTIDALIAMIFPISGVHRATMGIYSCSRSEPTDLLAAQRGRALCAVLPHEVLRRLRWSPDIISPSLTEIHGHHNIQAVKIRDTRAHPPGKKEFSEKDTYKASAYAIVSIPRGGIHVRPLTDQVTGKPLNYRIAYNNSLLKVSVGIVQIFYGIYELYGARGHQLRRFGYTAYSLTVIPYILMSLCNLVSSIFSPRYSSLFLVNMLPVQAPQDESEDQVKQQGSGYTPLASREDISLDCVSDGEPYVEKYGPTHSDSLADDEGTVYGAVGELCENFPVHFSEFPLRKDIRKDNLLHVLAWVVFFIAYTSSTAIILALTRFESQQSTRPQQVWTVVWLVISHTIGAGFHSYRMRIGDYFEEKAKSGVIDYNALPAIRLSVLLVGMVPFLGVAIGYFIMVGKMIMSDVVCTRI